MDPTATDRRLSYLRTGHPTLAFLLLAGLACEAPEPGPWVEADGHRWRELPEAGAGGPGFRAVPGSRTGVDFENRVSPERRLENELLTHGSGVALGDVDGDGLPDVYFARVDGPNVLYRNLGGWRFEDVTEASGTALEGLDATGVALADVDGDGDLDLFVASRGQGDVLMLNDGAGVFTDASEAAGVADAGGSTTVAFADVDGDGDLDLYVSRYRVRKAGNVFSPHERGFDQVVQRRGDEYRVSERFQDYYRLRVTDAGIVRWAFGEPDILYLNDGSGSFTAASWTAGRFLDPEGESLDSVPDEWGLTARFYDVNGDRAPDLYVSNDFESPDHFWLNQGDGTFRAVDPLTLRNTSASSMAVDFADVDRNGLVDFLVVDMLSLEPDRRRTQIPTIAPEVVTPGEAEPRLQHNRNTFFLARPDGTYQEAAFAAGLEASGWSWATLFMDVDLDGFEDVLITNGHVWDVLDADTQSQLLNTVVRDDWRAVIDRFPPLHVPNVAFRNQGDGTFEDASADWGFDLGPDISHGFATGDLDLDGDLDIVVNRLGFPAALLENTASAPRIAVRLAGADANRFGIGARVSLDTPEGVIAREMTAGGLYLSSAEPLVSLAAPGDGPFTLRVEWRGGGTSVIDDVRPNRLYEIDEDGASGGAPTAPGPAGVLADGQTPLFEDWTDRLGHTHVETQFNDFARQPLLPHRLSQLGPGVTWTDVDGDGDPDLIVPSGAGGTLGVLRNDGDRFTTLPGGLPATDFDQTVALPLPLGPGGALLVGRSNHEAATPEAAGALVPGLALPLSGGRPGPPRDILPPRAASVGAMAAADLDGDGVLEVLVAHRSYPAAYPEPAPPEIYRIDGSDLVLDSAATAALAGAGLVSAAVFTDIDDDGDADLVLATDWGPVRLYANHEGRLTEVTAEYGLADPTGRWNGVTAGDLDGDGRMDLVVTSWGRNTRYRPTAERPLRLYWGDFDGQGALDLLEAMPDPETGEDRPETDLARLSSAVPYVRVERVRTFQDFADATVRDVLGDQAMASARVYEATTFDHLVLMNRGDRFEAIPLPLEAQLAPAFHVAVADFDGDGREDVVLSQNFFPNEVNLQRYDAGRGLLLRGDGAGGLSPVPGERAGLVVYGDQRGAAVADFDGDGRADLAISQNGGETVLLRNRGGEPGLGVRLVGPPGNPRAAGARLRVVYDDDSFGPAREVHLGSGYWSVAGPVQVLGVAGTPRAVEVRWPGGRIEEVPVAEIGPVLVVRDGGAP